MSSTSRKPRVVSRPTPRALRSMTTLLPSVVPCTACATSRQATPALASSASSPARHASEGSGYVVSRLAVVSSPAGDCSTKSVNVPPTSKPIRYDTKSAPPLRAREHDAVGIAPSRLVGDRVLDRLAVGCVIRTLEHQQRRARSHLQELGDLARRQHGVGDLLERLDTHLRLPLDGRDERGLGQILVRERERDRRRQPHGDWL